MGVESTICIKEFMIKLEYYIIDLLKYYILYLFLVIQGSLGPFILRKNSLHSDNKLCYSKRGLPVLVF
jgi:hypothetical protein